MSAEAALKQSKGISCKATAVAEMINRATGSNYKESDFYANAGGSCRSIAGERYGDFIGEYKTDDSGTTREAQLNKINDSLSRGVPIVVQVSPGFNGARHHWVTILSKQGDTYWIADPADGKEKALNPQYTLGAHNDYGYVCLNGTGSHTHYYVSRGDYEALHPHRSYAVCSCGATQYVSGPSIYDSSCPDCKHTHNYVFRGDYEALHPHRNYAVCICGATQYVSGTSYMSSCSDCNPKTPGTYKELEYNGNHYQVFDEQTTWFQAKTKCEQLGGHLVTITSQGEQNFVNSMLDVDKSWTYYWLGATDEVSEGNWRWVTGEPFNYTAWNPGEPNNITGNENYLHMSTKDGKWNDTVATLTLAESGYICEWDSQAVTLSSIYVSAMPTKITYIVGDTLDTTGLSLTLQYSDGTTKSASSGFTVSPRSLGDIGMQQITVTYEGMSTSFNVQVSSPGTKPPNIGEAFPKQRAYDLRFRDVLHNDWFYANVITAYEFGFMEGTSSNAFSPKNEFTLAQGVTIAARINSIYHYGSDTIDRYDSGSWWNPYVDYANRHGIYNGNIPTDMRLTRREFAQIISNALPDDEALKAINTIDDGAIPDVQDVNSVSGQAIYRLYRAGIVEGSDTAHNYNPDSTISRAEIAGIVSRIADPSLRRSFSLRN